MITLRALGETRTPNTQIRNLVLCPLSYGRAVQATGRSRRQPPCLLRRAGATRCWVTTLDPSCPRTGLNRRTSTVSRWRSPGLSYRDGRRRRDYSAGLAFGPRAFLPDGWVPGLPWPWPCLLLAVTTRFERATLRLTTGHSDLTELRHHCYCSSRGKTRTSNPRLNRASLLPN